MSVIEQMKEGFIENVKKFNDAKKDRVSVFENEEKEKMWNDGRKNIGNLESIEKNIREKREEKKVVMVNIKDEVEKKW
jgi:hypothetical protein